MVQPRQATGLLLPLLLARGAMAQEMCEEFVTVANETAGADGSDENRFMAWSAALAGVDEACAIVSWRLAFGAELAEVVEFYVDDGTDFVGDDVALENGFLQATVTATTVTELDFSGGAYVCRACASADATKPGDTCWGITPITDSNRGCGCNSGSWTGEGLYYGGYSPGECNQCACWGGGFAGVKTSGQQKGALPSVGMRLEAVLSCPCAEYGGDSVVGQEKLTSGCDGDALYREQFILADDRRSYVIQQADGNLVLYSCHGDALWASDTAFGEAYGMHAVMQSDGSLVVQGADGHPYWASSSKVGGGFFWGDDYAPYEATVTDLLTFDITDREGDVEWSSSWSSPVDGLSVGACSPCADAACSNLLAARRIPAPPGPWQRWWQHLRFLAWFYRGRVLLVAAAVAAVAGVAWGRARRAGKGSRWAAGPQEEARPLLAPAAYGSTEAVHVAL